MYPLARWLAFGAVLGLFLLRVYVYQGWYIVCYGLGIYLLNLFIGFITPQIDPDTEGPTLPTKLSDSQEYKGFNRKLPEFKFWHSAFLAVFVSLLMSLIPLFDIPVFWPILVLYFLALFALTMKNQIAHMIKHRYIPISWGKARYGGSKGKKPSIERPAGGGTAVVTGSNLAAGSGLLPGGSAAANPGPRFTGSNMK